MQEPANSGHIAILYMGCFPLKKKLAIHYKKVFHTLILRQTVGLYSFF